MISEKQKKILAFPYSRFDSIICDGSVRSGKTSIMMSLALRDPSIMGKDTFGKDRLLKLVKAIGEYIDKYQPAWEKKEETDYYRAKLDASLAEAYGAGMHDTFMERYEFVPEFDYFTGKWRK